MRIHLFNFESRELSTLPESHGLWTARWSPNGKYIAALRAESHASPELRLFEWATQKWTSLARSGGIGEPSWSLDGRYIYFDTRDPNPDPALYRVRVPDGKPERLASLKGTRRAGVELWSGVTPDGSPLITRADVFQEIYALDVEWP